MRRRMMIANNQMSSKKINLIYSVVSAKAQTPRSTYNVTSTIVVWYDNGQQVVIAPGYSSTTTMVFNKTAVIIGLSFSVSDTYSTEIEDDTYIYKF